MNPYRQIQTVEETELECCIYHYFLWRITRLKNYKEHTWIDNTTVVTTIADERTTTMNHLDQLINAYTNIIQVLQSNLNHISNSTTNPQLYTTIPRLCYNFHIVPPNATYKKIMERSTPRKKRVVLTKNDSIITNDDNSSSNKNKKSKQQHANDDTTTTTTTTPKNDGKNQPQVIDMTDEQPKITTVQEAETMEHEIPTETTTTAKTTSDVSDSTTKTATDQCDTETCNTNQETTTRCGTTTTKPIPHPTKPDDNSTRENNDKNGKNNSTTNHDNKTVLEQEVLPNNENTNDNDDEKKNTNTNKQVDLSTNNNNNNDNDSNNCNKNETNENKDNENENKVDNNNSTPPTSSKKKCTRMSGLSRRQERLVRIELEEKEWEDRYHELQEFYKKYGHVRVLLHHFPNKTDISLYKWVNKVRDQFRRGSLKLTDEKIDKLNNIGFVWNPPGGTESFDERIIECNKFIQTYGHLQIPPVHEKRNPNGTATTEDQKWFRTWAAIIRNVYHGIVYEGTQIKLNDKRIAKLNTIGFDWGQPPSPPPPPPRGNVATEETIIDTTPNPSTQQDDEPNSKNKNSSLDDTVQTQIGTSTKEETTENNDVAENKDVDNKKEEGNKQGIDRREERTERTNPR